MITPVLITAPTKEAVSQAEAMDQIGLTASHDLQNLDLYIMAARQYFESRTGRTIHETEWEYALDYWPGNDMVLPRATPLISITSIKYKSTAGVESTWAGSSYIADTDSVPGRVALAYNGSWPSDALYPVNPIRVRYKAGIATASPITEASADIKIPILMLVAGAWENRESEGSDFAPGAKAIDFVEKWISKHIAVYVF